MTAMFLAIVVMYGIFGLALLVKYLKRKALQKSLMTAFSTSGFGALYTRKHLNDVMGRILIDGTPPGKLDLERLRNLGYFEIVDDDGLALCPDAVYEVSVIGGRVLFRKDLTLAGYKHYKSEIQEILTRAMEQKHLLPSDVEFLRSVNNWVAQFEGHRSPYRDTEYYTTGKVCGQWLNFYFNDNLALVVVRNDKDEVIWELPDKS